MPRQYHPDGNYNLHDDVWERLSQDDERSHLASGLKAPNGSPGQSPTACSSPLGLVELNKLVHRLSLKKDFSRPETQTIEKDFSRPETQTINEPRCTTPVLDPTRHETEAYHDLINDDGRPVYPISDILKVYRDPASYAETLRPWQGSGSHSYIFQRQLDRWQDFRKWQNDNRDLEDDDGGFLAYVELEKYTTERYRTPRFCKEHLAKIEADPSCLNEDWDESQVLRNRQRRLCREYDCRVFRDYEEAVKCRLARHGFTQPFKLNKDPKKQGQLTTWIEYLNYEFWWLDKYRRDIEHLELEQDKLWQKLVEENVLKPHETKEFVRTHISPVELENDKNLLWRACRRQGAKRSSHTS